MRDSGGDRVIDVSVTAGESELVLAINTDNDYQSITLTVPDALKFSEQINQAANLANPAEFRAHRNMY